MVRVLAISKRIILSFLRDRRTLAMICIVPLLVMTLVYLVLESEKDEFTLGLHTAGLMNLFEKEIIDVLEEEKIRVIPTPDGEMEERIKGGDLDAGMILPPDLIERRAMGDRGEIRLLLDGFDPMKAMDVMGEIQKGMSGMVDSLPLLLPLECSAECADDVNVKPPRIEKSYLYGEEDMDFIDFFSPVFAPFIAFFMVFLLTALSFLRERSWGTLERLLASPISRLEIYIGYILGFLSFALLQGTLVISYILFVMKVYNRGSIALIFLVVILMVITAESIGIFLSVYARNEFQVVQFIPLLILPQLFLSGIIWPVEDMGIFLRSLAYCMPLTYANFAARGVMIRGDGISEIYPYLFVLLLFNILSGTLAIRTLKREKL